jgi:hypothetical protein
MVSPCHQRRRQEALVALYGRTRTFDHFKQSGVLHNQKKALADVLPSIYSTGTSLTNYENSLVLRSLMETYGMTRFGYSRTRAVPLCCIM